jgi:cell wall assembly regulator SMI1
MQKQFDRLERCFVLLDLPMSKSPGASDKRIDRIEKVSGITIVGDLRAMWNYSDGSGAQPWFICDGEEERKLRQKFKGLVRSEDEMDAESFGGSVFTLYSVDEVVKWWKLFKDIDEQNTDGWETNTPDCLFPQELDKRIGPQMLRHKSRLAFGTLYGLDDELLFDGYPSKKGRYGQIVKYRHDPDLLSYVASSFADFFERSLYWMETIIPRNPDRARELLMDEKDRKY